MTEKLKEFFSKINLVLTDEELNYFDGATIQEPMEFSNTERKLRIFLNINNFLPVHVLHKVESVLRENNYIPTKINFNVKNDQKVTKDLIWTYLEYVKDNKAEVILTGAAMIHYDYVVYDENKKHITFLVASELERKLLNKHVSYYVRKLNKYGIKNISADVAIDEVKTKILKEETSKIIAQARKNEEVRIASIRKTEVQQATIEKQNAVNKNKKFVAKSFSQQLSEPTYSSLDELEENAQNVVLHGKVIKKQTRISKAGRKIYDIAITDSSSSVPCLMFSKSDDWNPFDDLPTDVEADIAAMKESIIGVGDWVALKGNYNFSNFDKSYTFYIDRYQKIESRDVEILDEEEVRRVELHTHTKMSTMDGVSEAKDYIKLASKWKWDAIAITDHLGVQSFPDAFAALKNVNNGKPDAEKLKLIYGSEINVVDENIWYVKNAKHEKLRDAKFIVFDLETTGLSPEYDEVIEFGANIYNYKTGESTRHDILIKPKNKISAFTTELTHITNEMLDDKEPIEVAFKKIYELISGGILVAHNANFDFNFLNCLSQRLGYGELTNTVIDTLTLSRVLIPNSKSHRLGTVAKNYHIVYDEKIAHRADYDAEVLTHVFEHMWSEAKKITPIDFDDDWNNLAPSNPFENANYIRSRGAHVNVIAKNKEGLKDLYKIISTSHTKEFMGSPKLFLKTLKEFKNKNNILLGSACVNGSVFENARTGTKEMLAEAISLFDFIEIQPLSVYKDLIQKNDLTLERLQFIVKEIILEAKRQNKIIVATGDVHYASKDLKKIREIYIHTKGLGGKAHPLYDYKQRVTDYPEQHLRTTSEMLKEWSWLEDSQLIFEIVVTNSKLIASMVEKNIEPVKSGSYPPVIKDADKLLQDECYKNARLMYGNKLPDIVKERLERELGSIIKHGFAVVYWISHLLVKRSLDDGYLVGSRGSVGSSLVATTSGITEVNPLRAHYRCEKCCYSDFETPTEFKCGFDLPKKDCPQCGTELIGDGHDIPFETFLGFDGDKVPDIDLNFSGEYQPKAHDFTKEIFGEDNVYRAGTISTVADKTAFGYVRGYMEKTNPHYESIPKVEVERLASMVAGTKRTTGQHPGGIIILPNEYEIEDFTPVNYPADDTSSSWKTTHFDFHSIHDNLLKMDILGHVDPTALRMLQDLTGIDPKKIPTNDENVYKLFTSVEPLGITPDKLEGERTGALGLPEFGTGFVRGMLNDTKPKTFADLVQLSGLSHGTDVYLGNAQTLIQNGTATISTVIGCRDEIMVYLMAKGLDSSLAFTIMESVRKGKGVQPGWIEEMKKHEVPDWYIDSCTKIKYMFPKAHATAYVLMAYRVAWFKIYYPIEYYATYFSTRIDAFDLESVINGEETVLKSLREIRKRIASNEQVTTKEQQLIPVYEILLEMFSRGIKMNNIDFNISESTKFVVWENKDGGKVIYPPFNTIDSLGEAVGDSIVNARRDHQIKSVVDLKNRTQVTQTQMNIFKKLKIIDSLVDDEQMSFNF
jgi:DNA polymerase-3 subunit alpha (Gram-positive type)